MFMWYRWAEAFIYTIHSRSDFMYNPVRFTILSPVCDAISAHLSKDKNTINTIIYYIVLLIALLLLLLRHSILSYHFPFFFASVSFYLLYLSHRIGFGLEKFANLMGKEVKFIPPNLFILDSATTRIVPLILVERKADVAANMLAAGCRITTIYRQITCSKQIKWMRQCKNKYIIVVPLLSRSFQIKNGVFYPSLHFFVVSSSHVCVESWSFR